MMIVLIFDNRMKIFWKIPKIEKKTNGQIDNNNKYNDDAAFSSRYI